ncbi:encapsidation protein 22K [Crane-associated adenovirus 1]|uniref:Encapsidation protein 22K n=1 Tax=Crane-associated adenovirus 1 TaxID=2559941 RepID=A0A5H2WY37_9ADEN|nr:encapsidation protein 22K [Crane-associated adenovirus 1]
MAQKMIDEKKINQNDSEDEESIGSQDSFHSMDSVESVPSPELQKKTFQTMKTDSNTLPKPKERSTRGKYRSWVQYRVIIHQALRDAVFDRKKASAILRDYHKVFIPPSVIGYYSRKLSASLPSLNETF